MQIFGSPNVNKMKATKDVHGLIKALGYKKDPEVRGAAALALEQIGETTVSPLISMLKNEDISGDAARVLVRIGKPAIEPLILALDEEDIREAASKILVTICEPAVEPLIAALKVEETSVVTTRKHVINVLVKIGEPAIEPLMKIINKKMYFVNKGYFELMGYVAWALGELGDKRAVKPINEFLKIELGSTTIGAGSLEEAVSKMAAIRAEVDASKNKARTALEKFK